MPKPPHVRKPVFFTAPLLRRVDAVVTEFGGDRSKVVRRALERGLPAATKQLRREKEARLRELGAQDPAADPATGASIRLSYEEAVEKIRSFGDDLRRIDGQQLPASALLEVLRTFANTLEINPDDFEDALLDAHSRVVSGDVAPDDLRDRPDPHQPPD